MKVCSKCRRDLEIGCFVNSARYLDGKYPLCKDCRKSNRQKYLARNPLCYRCKEVPHTANNPYCLRCQRVKAGRTPERVRRKAILPELCPVCNQRRKQDYHGYCRECAHLKHKEWLKRNGGQWAVATKNGTRHKLVARAYVNTLVQRGRLVRKPCEICGKLETEAHHNSYENPVDIRWLCEEHHDALERWIRMRKKKTC